MAQLRDGNACGGQTQHVGRNSNILGAHYNGCRLGVVCLSIVDRSLFSSAYDAKPAVEQIFNRVDGATFTAHGQIAQRSCRCLHGVGAYAYASTARDYNGVDAGTLAGACYRAEVAYVGYSVEHHYERHTSFLEKRRHHSVKSRVAHGRQHSHHTLVVAARKPVDFLNRHFLEEDFIGLEHTHKFAGKVALQGVGYENLVDFASGLHGLDYGAYAVYIVGIFHR